MLYYAAGFYQSVGINYVISKSKKVVVSLSNKKNVTGEAEKKLNLCSNILPFYASLKEKKV